MREVQSLPGSQDQKCSQEVIAWAFEEFASKLRYYCLSLGADPHRADDIVQETFYKALRSFQKTQPIEVENVRAWLYKVAHNLFVDEVRRDSRSREVPITEYEDSQGMIWLIEETGVANRPVEEQLCHKDVLEQSYYTLSKHQQGHLALFWEELNTHTVEQQPSSGDRKNSTINKVQLRRAKRAWRKQLSILI